MNLKHHKCNLRLKGRHFAAAVAILFAMVLAGCATGRTGASDLDVYGPPQYETALGQSNAQAMAYPQEGEIDEFESGDPAFGRRRSVEGRDEVREEGSERRSWRIRSNRERETEDSEADRTDLGEALAESSDPDEQPGRRLFWRRRASDPDEPDEEETRDPETLQEEEPIEYDPSIETLDDDQSQRTGRFRFFRRRSDPAEDEGTDDIEVLEPSPVVAVAPITGRRQESILRPGLPLSVKVLVAGRAEVESAGIRISDRGSIVLPLVGAVPVSHLNLDELHDDLTTRYRRFFVDPQVIVDFARDGTSDGISPWGYVTVLGRVRNPGRVMIPATRDLTVSGAIQRAGGFDTSARVNAIRVTRRISEDETETRVINLIAVGADGRLEDDVLLIMDDVVFVPEARF